MTNTADRDPVLMAVADGIMDTRIPFIGDWRLYPRARALRDAIYAALLSERQRAREEMRDRAAHVAYIDGNQATADGIRSLSTED